MKIILSVFLMTSCIPTHSGYNFEEHTPCSGNIAKNTKNDIIDIFGSPTIATPEGDKLIYASRKSYKFLFMRNIRTQQKMCIFTFNRNNILISVTQK